MSKSIDQRTRETLRNYLRDVKTLPNEAAKRQRFSALIGELFPGTNAITEYARGIEKLIRISRPDGEKRGHADAYYGQAIIEFEKSLAATLSEAEEQLREYVAGTWQKDGDSKRQLLAIASDGVTWRIYRPISKAGQPISPDSVSLDLLREFKLADDTLSAFWLWLTSLLFRPQQVEPTAERFQLDFGSWSPLFRDGLASLRRAWAKVSDQSEARLAFETWQRYLTVTYGRLAESASAKKDDETGESVSELEELFLRHTYLSSIARLLIWASLSQGKSTGALRKVAQDVLTGRYFHSKRLANLVDDDFFHWIRNRTAEETLAPAWERILSHLLEYNLSRINEDVLKGVYQQLIDPKDRHDLGEYYTPDWLCERIISELLPKHGFKAVLDPSCGSGSFLRAAVTHFLRNNPGEDTEARLRQVLSNVKGIDIHPVAVTIARATYVLALGPLVKKARKPIQIPVYLADSLFLPREVETSLIENLSGVEITFGARKDQRQVVIPEMLIHAPELFDDAIAACTTIAEEHAGTGKESKSTMTKHLEQSVPELPKLLEYPKVLDALWSFTHGLAELIRERKNSIWSFIIRNSYRPAMFRQQFDYIIGNPPWLSYRYISDPDYQDEIKRRAVERYKIAPKSQKLFTQMELATVFLAHSMATFARAECHLGFVMPRSVLTADQHQNLILRKYSAPFRLTGYWDLWEVAPLFNVPCCVLFAKRDTTRGNPGDKLAILEWSGTLPERDIRWEIAEPRLSTSKKEARVVFLGSRAAFSTQPGASSQTRASKYANVFKQGATIVPRNFYFVEITDLDGQIDPARTYWAITDEEQAKDSKPPYQEIRFSGPVEGRFIYCTAISRHVLPFSVLRPATVVLPIETQNDGFIVRDAASLKREGFREFGKWMTEAEALWDERRKDKAHKQSLLDRLDYQGGVRAQSLRYRHLVLYNAAGTNVSAAYFDRKSFTLPFIVEHKLYWAALPSVEEADYLVAVLNSATANDAIKPFQSTGLLGERDIEKKLLDLPIPTFDTRAEVHCRLSELGAQARILAAQAINSDQFPRAGSLARQRAYARVAVKPILIEIDQLVRKLL